MAADIICSDFGAQEIKSVTASTFSPYICHEVMGSDVMTLVFSMLSFSSVWFSCSVVFDSFCDPMDCSTSGFPVHYQFFHFLLSNSPRGSIVPLHFLPLEWSHLHIWGCWYFSLQSWFQLVLHLAWHFTWCTLLNKQGDNIQPCRTPLPS